MICKLDRKLRHLSRGASHPQRDVDGASVSRLDAFFMCTHRVNECQVGLRVLFDELEALHPQRMRTLERASRSFPLLGGESCRLLDQGRCSRHDRAAR
jgi:hypothetical protein